MHTLFRIFIFSVSLHFHLYAAPASIGIKTFTQPDGTIFQGILKGTSAFHWIQSNGEIVKYNNKDKFYHIAIFDKNTTLILTDRLPQYKKRSLYQKHTLKKEDLIKLKKLYNQMYNQNLAQ